MISGLCSIVRSSGNCRFNRSPPPTPAPCEHRSKTFHFTKEKMAFKALNIARITLFQTTSEYKISKVSGEEVNSLYPNFGRYCLTILGQYSRTMAQLPSSFKINVYNTFIIQPRWGGILQNFPRPLDLFSRQRGQ